MIDFNDAGPQIDPGCDPRPDFGDEPEISIDDIDDALNCISPDCDRAEWIKVGMALHSIDHKISGIGKDLWRDWSQGSRKYKKEALDAAWRSFYRDGRIGIGTLFTIAKSYGYRPSGRRERADPAVQEKREIARARAAEDERKERERRDRRAITAAKLWDESIPLQGSDLPARYFAGRGIIPMPDCAEMRFHGDAGDYGMPFYTAAIVSKPINGKGDPVPGVHRTFIDAQTGQKIDKKALGEIAGGAVRLAPIGQDGRLAVAEGIETACAVMKVASLPCWAALSRHNLEIFDPPEGVKTLFICADNDKSGNGLKSAVKLRQKCRDMGLPCSIMLAKNGDFLDDLLAGCQMSDYSPYADDQLPQVADMPKWTFETLQDLAGKMREGSSPDELGQLIQEMVRAELDPIQEDRIFQIVKKSAKIPMGTLRDATTRIKRMYGATGEIERSAARPPWHAMLRKDVFGVPERNESSVITGLTNDPAFAGAIGVDEFQLEIVVLKPLPWDTAAKRVPRNWLDVDNVFCADWLQQREINVSPRTVSRSIQAVATSNPVNRMRDYLTSLVWDDVERLDTWTITLLGAPDTRLNREIGRMWMISAVARIFSPGCKVDTMLILEGPQGLQKSTALKLLAGEENFTDQLSDVSSKDAAQELRGVWIVEVAELDAFSRADVRRIKSFLSRTFDRYRPPYEPYVIKVLRQCVFAGTVNPETYLQDPTGNRRFWPVKCSTINLSGITDQRDQLWAEAVVQFRHNAKWWLTDREILQLAKDEQSARVESDSWDDLIEDWLQFDNGIRRFAPITDVSVGEILSDVIKLEAAKHNRGEQMRVSNYLKKNGWERYQRTLNGVRTWRYRISHN